MSLMRTVLFTNQLFSVRHVACRKATKEKTQEEFSDTNVVILPVRGAFVEHYTAKNSVLADPTIALVFPSGSSSRISHPVHSEDDCFVFELSSSCFRKALYAASGAENLRIPAHCVLPLQDLACRSLLLYRLQRGIANSLEIEETCLTLLNSILTRIYGTEKQMILSDKRKRARISTQIEEVKMAFSANPEAKWNLAELGRLVKISPFHLTRLFRETTGLPLHRYLLFSRLERAMDSLLNTNRDLTEIALDLSFSSHSHFTSAFHKMIGVTPSVFRSTATSRSVEETRKILRVQLSGTQRESIHRA
jgi:AraC family transcriptional regulator